MYSPILSQRDKAVGVIPPPPGITPDFANPPSRWHVIIIVHIVLPIISTLFIGLRFYTARFITRHVRVDDSTQYGLGRHLWDVLVLVFSPNYLKFGAISGTFYGISIMLTKLSILTLFLRFVLWGSLRVALYIIMVIVVVYSLVTSFVWVYACQPLEKIWNLTITGGSCINWLKVTVFSGVMNTTTDAAILILPVLFLRKLQLPKRQKIGVMVVLMTGGFILIVSIIRLKSSVDLVNTMDISWEMVRPVVWCAIEVHIAIVCACLSAGKPFLRKHMPWVIGSSDGASSAAIKLRTIRSTHTQRLPSRGAGDDPQDTILRDDTNSELRRHLTTYRLANKCDVGRSPKNESAATVELGME
ncbi:hypothetical protein GQ44DRAFT_690258 [Phaeosphaeriaceae sp. PMI808]|nr:hypothetical protein GQ44DRAFT_690258 [Phaeosphaeriaceae sp. PMI808]